MANYIELANKIRGLVSRDQIKLAFDQLKDALQTHPTLDQVVLQSAQQEALRKQLMNGVISTEIAGREQNRIRTALLDLVRDLEREGKAKTKVFISHSHSGPGEGLALALHQTLKEKGFGVFLDRVDLQPGQDWAISIISELKSSDYFVLLLSPEANNSEMVLKEVDEARRLKDKTGKPILLPIRIQWPEGLPLNPRLGGWLQRIQHLNWKEEKDSAAILRQIISVIQQRKTLAHMEAVTEEEAQAFVTAVARPPSPVASLEIPRGAVRIDSKFYIERPHETQFIARVATVGALLRIRGPRQYGKTSLLARVIAFARELGHTVVSMDFQDFSENTLADREAMIWSFCNCIAEELDLEDELENLWDSNPRKDPKQRARSFLRKVVFKAHDGPLLIAIDEADRVFVHKEVSSDFFLMLRGWHEKGKTNPEWEVLKMAISYSTEAMLAITDLNASPFNVGEEARMVPFTKEQVGVLVQRHALLLSSQQIDQLMWLLGGQPYLVRRALYLLANSEYSFERLMAEAVEHDGPFNDHLRHHLVNVCQFEDISTAFRTILEDGKCKDSILAERLRAAGLVIGSPPAVKPACGLYQQYFTDKF